MYGNKWNTFLLIYRKIVSFLYETNPPKSGKGKSMCSFALEAVYNKLAGDESAGSSPTSTTITHKALFPNTLDASGWSAAAAEPLNPPHLP